MTFYNLYFLSITFYLWYCWCLSFWITPLSAQISVSKFQNLSQISLKICGVWLRRGFLVNQNSELLSSRPVYKNLSSSRLAHAPQADDERVRGALQHPLLRHRVLHLHKLQLSLPCFLFSQPRCGSRSPPSAKSSSRITSENRQIEDVLWKSIVTRCQTFKNALNCNGANWVFFAISDA